MPFKSRAQIGWMATHQKQVGGHEEFLKWLHETPDIKKLPRKVKKEEPKK